MITKTAPEIKEKIQPMTRAPFFLTFAVMILFSTIPASAAEPLASTPHSSAVSTLQQPLPVPPEESEICPPPPTVPGVSDNAAPQSPAAGPVSSVQEASKPFTIVLFWGEGCPHCATEKDFLKESAKQFPSMLVRLFEVWRDRNNAVLMERLAGKYGLRPPGVPITFIGDKVYVGFSPSRKTEIIDAMKKCAETGCPDPLDRLKGEKN